MKLLIIQFSPSPSHVVPLNRNILFSTIIKHPASVFSSCGKGSRFTCIKNPELDTCKFQSVKKYWHCEDKKDLLPLPGHGTPISSDVLPIVESLYRLSYPQLLFGLWWLLFFDASFHILELNVRSMLWCMVCDLVQQTWKDGTVIHAKIYVMKITHLVAQRAESQFEQKNVVTS